MKVRTDFVTNSSSSSFVIYGIDKDDLPKEIEFDRWGDYGVLDVEGRPDEDYSLYVGLTPDTLECQFPDVRFSELRKVVANEINKVFGTSFEAKDIECYEDGWFDG